MTTPADIVSRDADTLLVISDTSGNVISRYSSRGVHEDIEQFSGSAHVRESCNGKSLDWSRAQSRKFEITVTCTDNTVPALDGVWPGDIVSIECIREFSYRTVGGVQVRPAVSGSERTEGDFTFYRPTFTARVLDPHSAGIDEWGADVAWKFKARELEVPSDASA